MNINFDLATKAFAHDNDVGNPEDTEFEIRRGRQEWDKFTDLMNDVSELILEGQKNTD